MERTIKAFFRDPRTRWTLIASWITGFAAYGYGMLNNLVNYDTIYNIPLITGGEERSGRWTLSLLAGLTEALHLGYSLPFFNILFSLLLLSLSAVLLCKLLGFRSRRACVLTGVVLLGEKMTVRETVGCVLMFVAVVLAQLSPVISSIRRGGRSHR